MNTHCLYPNCGAKIENPYHCAKYCDKHKAIARTEQRQKASKKQTEKLRQERVAPTLEANTDCPFWSKKSCGILSPPICRVKECGFYPPVAEARKARMRQIGAELHGISKK